MQSRSCILRAIERMGTGLAQGYEGLHIGVGSFPRVVIRENRRSNSMRRVVLLAVLALALPTAALANICTNADHCVYANSDNVVLRSDERRVGKESRSRSTAYH